jgi:hypothetical protein
MMAVRRRSRRARSACTVKGRNDASLSPNWFDAIIPRQLPGSPRRYTYLAGGANLIAAGGLAVPKTRSPASGLAAALFIAYLPAKIKLAADWWRSERASRVVKSSDWCSCAGKFPSSPKASGHDETLRAASSGALRRIGEPRALGSIRAASSVARTACARCLWAV